MKKLVFLGLALSLISISGHAVKCGTFIEGQKQLMEADLSSIDLRGNSKEIQDYRALWHNSGYSKGFVIGLMYMAPHSDYAKKLNTVDGQVLYNMVLRVCKNHPDIDIESALLASVEYFVKDEEAANEFLMKLESK